MEYIALVFDPQSESDLVFFVHARNPEHVRRQIRQYYKKQDWPSGGITIKVKSLNIPEGQSIQMIGHRYVKGMEEMSEHEKIAVMHQDV